MSAELRDADDTSNGATTDDSRVIKEVIDDVIDIIEGVDVTVDNVVKDIHKAGVTGCSGVVTPLFVGIRTGLVEQVEQPASQLGNRNNIMSIPDVTLHRVSNNM